MSKNPDDDARTRRARSRVGTVLRDKWTLDRVLGIGGMAAVFAATHRNGSRGAVKMLHSELHLDEDARSRFLREGYVANKVGHPGAVSVLDDDVAEDGSVFLVMELLEGATLDAVVSARPSRKLEIAEVLDMTEQLLDVLAAAHEKGIVHRDLKPENLFVTARGELKVLDFGIARLRERQSGRRATQTGEAMGTPTFMPPEQALGNWDAVDARTDVWAVGATMFSLLTGRVVHEADTVQKVMLAAMTRTAPLLQSILPGVPPTVAGVVNRALMFEASERWPSARAMQEAVQRARSAVPPGSTSRGLTLGHGASAAAADVDASSPTIVAHTASAPARTRARTSPLGVLLGGLGALAIAAVGLAMFASAKHGPGLAAPGTSAAETAPAPTAAPTGELTTEPSATATASAPENSASPTVDLGPPPSASASASAKAKAKAKPGAPATSRPSTKKNPLTKW